MIIWELDIVFNWDWVGGIEFDNLFWKIFVKLWLQVVMVGSDGWVMKWKSWLLKIGQKESVFGLFWSG